MAQTNAEANRLYRQRRKLRDPEWAKEHNRRAHKWAKENGKKQKGDVHGQEVRRRQRHKDAVYEFMGGYKCKHCGATEDLKFHHLDPSTKSFEIGDCWLMALSYLLPEAAKCIMLCLDCHTEAHRELRAHCRVGSAGTVFAIFPSLRVPLPKNQ